MKQFILAVKAFILLTILTGFLYPLILTGIVQLVMPDNANGSLIKQENAIVGSKFISQNTSQEALFWPRPSAIDFNPIAPSGGSNLGPTSKKLKEAILERKKTVGENAPAELLYASGSGLDPHISLETAYYQVPRIAKTNQMNENEVKSLVDSLAEGSQLGFIGPRYVNVLLLNLELLKRKNK